MPNVNDNRKNTNRKKEKKKGKERPPPQQQRNKQKRSWLYESKGNIEVEGFLFSVIVR